MERFPKSGTSRVHEWLKRLANVEPEEIPALFWSFSYFFALLCAYYIVRPMRDTMGIAGGVKNLQWLFTGTFLAMLVAVHLFGWVTSRYPPQKVSPPDLPLLHRQPAPLLRVCFARG